MLLLALALILRVLTLPLAPLADHTEARYAEIARLMLQTGDWISPRVRPDEVFWAKPPLSTWSQALMMAVLGVHEWSARLASLLWSGMALASLSWMLRGSVGDGQRWAAMAGLMLCPLFFVCAGAVMTDAPLGATVMLVQAAWWRALCADGAERRRAGRVLALGLGLALLNKGPAAAVLALLPPLLHALWRRHWGLVKEILRDPIAWGIWIVIAVPWYVVAELKTPGFLQYFVLGEHVMRFLQPGWKGDRYGFAHAEPLGMIWLFALTAALPWVLSALLRGGWLAWRRGRPALAVQWERSLGLELFRYALCIAAAPLLLFTAAGNIIWTYALTALPGLVLVWLACWEGRQLGWRGQAGLAALMLAATAWAFCVLVPEGTGDHSDLTLISAYEKACGPAAWTPACALRYEIKPPHSAYFYSAGRLYGQESAPQARWVVRDRGQVAVPEQALACNKDQCLLSAENRSQP